MSNGVLRALVVAPTPTWPLDYGNRKRIYMVCKWFKDNDYDVHYVHYAAEADWRGPIPKNSRRVMAQQWDMVDHIFPSIDIHSGPKDGEDHLIDEWWDPVLESHLRSVISYNTYDVVVVNYTWLSKALELVPERCVSVLDTHDKFSGRRQLLELNGVSKEFFHTTELEEMKGLSRAKIVWAIKDEELREFARMGVDSELKTLIHIDEQVPSKEPRRENGYVTFGFIGARNNVNRVNLENFLTLALPIFEKYLPPLSLHVAGSVCNEFDGQQNDYVKFVGHVDSAQEFYDSIDVVVVPMGFSTGLKIKVGEAISHSKPVISHKHAMEGYPSMHSLHVCQAFKDIALEMCRMAYDVSDIEELELASIASYSKCKLSIAETFQHLDGLVHSKSGLVFILPEEYGDERSPLHWLVKSHMDWLSERVNPICVSIHKPRFGLTDSRVRYVEYEKLKGFLALSGKAVYVLDDSVLDSLPTHKGKVFSYFDLSENIDGGDNTRMSFLPYGVGYHVPSLGAVKIPYFEKNDRSGLVVLCEEKQSSVVQLLLRMLEKHKGELVHNVCVYNLRDVDRLVSGFYDKGLIPRKVLVLKDVTTLNVGESFLIDMLASQDVGIHHFNGIVDLAHLCDGLNSGAEFSESQYVSQCNSAWQSFDKVLSSFSSEPTRNIFRVI